MFRITLYQSSPIILRNHPALSLRRRSLSTAERVLELSNHVDVHCGVPLSLISRSLMSVGARLFSRPILLEWNTLCAFFFLQLGQTTNKFGSTNLISFFKGATHGSNSCVLLGEIFSVLSS
jgi:hypothetical protein